MAYLRGVILLTAGKLGHMNRSRMRVSIGDRHPTCFGERGTYVNFQT